MECTMNTWLSSALGPRAAAHRPPDPEPVEQPPQEPHPAPDDDPVPDHNPSRRPFT
jgi:hypothetical protein